MISTLTTAKKRNKIETAIKIMTLSDSKSITIAKASKHYKKNRRFIYDVNRRWVKKNNYDLNSALVEQFRKLYNSK